MTATTSPPPVAPALRGDACVACQAPLRPAAGYCLTCGARQGGAPTELIDLVAASAPPASAGSPAAPAGPATVLSPRTASGGTWPFALTAVVLLALVVGLVAGRLLGGGRDGSSGAQVVRVEGAAPAAEAAGAAEPAAEGVAADAATGDGSTANGPTAAAPGVGAAPDAGAGAAAAPTAGQRATPVVP